MVANITELMQYLDQYPQATQSFFILVGDLLQIHGEPQRDELLQRAQQSGLATPRARNAFLSGTSSDSSSHQAENWNICLPLEWREFVAKRLFAFARKGMWKLVQQKWQTIAQNPQEWTSAHLIALLEFSVHPEDLASQITPISLVTTTPVSVVPSEIKPSEIKPPEIKPPEIKPPEAKSPTVSIPATPPEPRSPMSTATKATVISSASLTPIPKTTPPPSPSPTANTATLPVVSTAPQPTAALMSPTPSPQPSSTSDTFEEILDSRNAPDLTPEAMITEIAGIPLIPIGDDEEVEVYQQRGLEQLEKHYRQLKEFQPNPYAISSFRDLIVTPLAKSGYRQLPRVIKGALSRSPSKSQQKLQLMKCKDALLKHENASSSPLTLQAMIVYGQKFCEATLDKFAKLSDIPEVNQAARQFFQSQMEQALDEYIQQFRRQVELCQTELTLRKLLAEHAVQDDSFITQYPKLQIIQQLTKIYKDYQTHQGKLDKILQDYFGNSEIHIRHALVKILTQSAGFLKFAEELRPVRDINGLFRALQHLKRDPELTKTAGTVFDMVVMFLRGHSHITFAMLQASVNFLSPRLQHQILWVVQKRLQQILEQKVAEILDSQSAADKRWKKLLQLLHHPQFWTAGLQLFSYPLPVLIERSQKVFGDTDPQKIWVQRFGPDTFPISFWQLIMAAAALQSASKNRKA